MLKNLVGQHIFLQNVLDVYGRPISATSPLKREAPSVFLLVGRIGRFEG